MLRGAPQQVSSRLTQQEVTRGIRGLMPLVTLAARHTAQLQFSKYARRVRVSDTGQFARVNLENNAPGITQFVGLNFAKRQRC